MIGGKTKNVVVWKVETMVKVRVHGRGGQGAVTFAHILCASVSYEDKFGQSCMAPTLERRGAPVEAYARIDDEPIAERGAVLDPDYVVVLSPTLATVVSLEAGMGESGKLVVNSARVLRFKHEAIYIDATSLALKILKIPINNTVMLGAFAAATGLISLGSLEKGAEIILSAFEEEKLKLNLDAIRAGYEEVKHGKVVY